MHLKNNDIIVALDGSGQYLSIQQAIDVAQPNAKIIVKQGIYEESLYISKHIQITAQDKQTVQIANDNNCVQIENANVSFHNIQFYSTQADITKEEAGPAKSKIDDTTITALNSTLTLLHCEVKDAKGTGILLEHSTCHVNYCAIDHNEGNGIESKQSKLLIENSRVQHNARTGVSAIASDVHLLSTSFSSNQLSNIACAKKTTAKISRCTVQSAGQSGLFIRDKSCVTIEHSQLQDNTQSNMSVDTKASVAMTNCSLKNSLLGITVTSSGEVMISDSSIHGTQSAAIQLSKKGRIVAEHVTMQQNMVHILAKDYSEATLKQCELSNSAATAIEIKKAQLTLEDSQLFDSNGNGVYVTDQAKASITNCKVFRNSEANIYVSTKSELKMTTCHINDSLKHGLYIEDAKASIDHSLFQHNEASNIEVTIDSDLQLVNCEITDSASIGIHVNTDSTAHIEHSELKRNHYSNIVVERDATIHIENSKLTNSNGHAVWLYEGGKGAIHTTTMQHNEKAACFVEKKGHLLLHTCNISNNADSAVFAREQGTVNIEATTIRDNVKEQVFAASEATVHLNDSFIINGKSYGIYNKSAHVLLQNTELRDNEKGDLIEVGVTKQSNVEIEKEPNALLSINNLTGLHNLKQHIQQFINTTKFMQKRKEAGIFAEPVTLHSVFIGHSGTGKTTVAKLLGQALYEAGVIEKPDVIQVSRKDLVGQHVGATAMQTEQFLQAALGGVLFVDEAYTLYQDSTVDYGQEAVTTIQTFMEEHRHELMVIFAGLPNEMQSFLTMNPGLASRCPNVFYFDDFTLGELVEIGFNDLLEKEYVIDYSLYSDIIKNQYIRSIDKSNARWVRNQNDRLIQIMANRVMSSHTQDLQTITANDLYTYVGMETVAKEQKVTMLLQQLEALTGLDDIKQYVNNLVKQVKADRRLAKQGILSINATYHMVFAGNPGTGKTTVAHIIAELFHYLDILPKPVVRYVDRTDLVGSAVGETEKKTREVIEQALGGVLFIDEAYQLYNEAQNDYGKLAIETLLTYLENYRDKFIVIFAGYTKEMEQFINSNPGLRSRIPNHIQFPDYSSQQIVKIIDHMLKKDWQFNYDHLANVIESIYRDLPVQERSNGRWARHTYDRLIHLHKLAIIDKDLNDENIRIISNETISKLK